MIALNEILKNKDEFVRKYQLMGKSFNLDKIIKLEEKFIIIDKRKNETRAACNKLCAQVAELINENKPTKNLIEQINKLDKRCITDEKKSKKAMLKINKLLSKLPNIPLDENILNISYKTHINSSFALNELKNEINKIAELILEKKTPKQYLKNHKNQVIQVENLPKCLLFKSQTNSPEILILLDNQSKETFDKLLTLLQNNALLVIDKSINTLNKTSSKEILTRLSDDSIAQINYVGEYISRDLGLKFYDRKTDMTRFVNLIKIKIKCHG